MPARPRRSCRPSFARRYRVSWQRVRGHDALVRAFQRVIRRGRLAHAYLFTGPQGVGKKLFATELAKTLLCEATESRLEACDVCPSCVQVEAGTHPDFLCVGRPEDALEFPIDVMRDLCQRFSLKSARGRGKVVVLDDADDLNRESANCFLKTLEEPPPRSVLVLIGSSPDRQLPTIVSRCQVIRFAPLQPEAVSELLQAQGMDDPALRERLARLSGGSVGRALGFGGAAGGAGALPGGRRPDRPPPLGAAAAHPRRAARRAGPAPEGVSASSASAPDLRQPAHHLRKRRRSCGSRRWWKR